MPDASPSTSSDASQPPVPIAGRSARSWVLFLLTSSLILAADLMVKHIAFERVAGSPVTQIEKSAVDHDGFWELHAHPPVVVIPHVLNMQLTTNAGAVFGLGRGNQWFFVMVAACVTPIIAFIFHRTPRDAWVTQLALAFILAGALGNLYDRIMFNVVRDMFHLFPGTRLWPWIFNVADAALVVAVCVLVVRSFIFGDKPSQTAPAGPG